MAITTNPSTIHRTNPTTLSLTSTEDLPNSGNGNVISSGGHTFDFSFTRNTSNSGTLTLTPTGGGGPVDAVVLDISPNLGTLDIIIGGQHLLLPNLNFN
jgi:hypothetical protein